MHLTDNGAALIIQPSTPPFSIRECAFEQYIGVFVTTISTGAGTTGIHHPLQRLRRLRRP